MTASYGASGNSFRWSASAAPDLREYRLYRGETRDFAPAAGDLVGATRDTALTDPRSGAK